MFKCAKQFGTPHIPIVIRQRCGNEEKQEHVDCNMPCIHHIFHIYHTELSQFISLYIITQYVN